MTWNIIFYKWNFGEALEQCRGIYKIKIKMMSISKVFVTGCGCGEILRIAYKGESGTKNKGIILKYLIWLLGLGCLIFLQY